MSGSNSLPEGARALLATAGSLDEVAHILLSDTFKLIVPAPAEDGRAQLSFAGEISEAIKTAEKERRYKVNKDEVMGFIGAVVNQHPSLSSEMSEGGGNNTKYNQRLYALLENEWGATGDDGDDPPGGDSAGEEADDTDVEWATRDDIDTIQFQVASLRQDVKQMLQFQQQVLGGKSVAAVDSQPRVVRGQKEPLHPGMSPETRASVDFLRGALTTPGARVTGARVTRGGDRVGGGPFAASGRTAVAGDSEEEDAFGVDDADGVARLERKITHSRVRYGSHTGRVHYNRLNYTNPDNHGIAVWLARCMDALVEDCGGSARVTAGTQTGQLLSRCIAGIELYDRSGSFQIASRYVDSELSFVDDFNRLNLMSKTLRIYETFDAATKRKHNSKPQQPNNPPGGGKSAQGNNEPTGKGNKQGAGGNGQ